MRNRDCRGVFRPYEMVGLQIDQRPSMIGVWRQSASNILGDSDMRTATAIVLSRRIFHSFRQ